jgi:primary-amine oxidase
MGWGLYLGFNRDMGLSLWDIRFKGERIIYEVGIFMYHATPVIHFNDRYVSCAQACTSRGDRTIWYSAFCYQFPTVDAHISFLFTAGSDPIQSTTAWLDRFFGMGAAVRDALPGYDCPHEAVYLPATTHSSVGSSTSEHAICIFEHDTGRPLTRHAGDSEGEFGAVKGYVLTVRSISTVGK